jgi:hypothetical protein
MPGRLPYEVLWLGEERYFTCATLRKVKALLDAGARVAGMRPTGTPSLSDKTAEWRELADAIWGGKYTNLKQVDSSLAAVQAFGVRAPVESGGVLKALRRVIEGRDFYFVVNTTGAPFNGTVSFKGNGRPEQWDAKSGRIVPLPWLEDERGRVKAKVTLRADESMFVSFREPKEGERPLRSQQAATLPMWRPARRVDARRYVKDQNNLPSKVPNTMPSNQITTEITFWRLDFATARTTVLSVRSPMK